MVEVVFVYPGLGQLIVDSVQKRDIPVVQACSLIFAATYVLLNLTADILVHRHQSEIAAPEMSDSTESDRRPDGGCGTAAAAQAAPDLPMPGGS